MISLPEYIPGSPCPCGCGATGSRLAQKSGHVARECSCPSCRNRRNRNRGQRTEARRHRRLGGQGFTPNDELGTSYSINITTQDKGGKQVPASFRKFAEGEFFRHAISQAERAAPVGSGALPALYLELSPSRAYLVVDVGGRDLRG